MGLEPSKPHRRFPAASEEPAPESAAGGAEGLQGWALRGALGKPRLEAESACRGVPLETDKGRLERPRFLPGRLKGAGQALLLRG